MRTHGYPPVDILRVRILCCGPQNLGKHRVSKTAHLESYVQLVGRRSRRRWANRSAFPFPHPSGLEQQAAQRQKSNWFRSSSRVGKDEFMMANQETRKCAHIPCLCDVPKGIEYCSDLCRDAGSDDVEIACQCDHTSCPLTVRPYVPRIVADLAN
jgi:hypothetical protein